MISRPTAESIAAHARCIKEKMTADALLELGKIRDSEAGSPDKSTPPSHVGTGSVNPNGHATEPENTPTPPLHNNDMGDNKDSDDEPLSNVQDQLRAEAEDNIPLSDVQKNRVLPQAQMALVVGMPNLHQSSIV